MLGYCYYLDFIWKYNTSNFLKLKIIYHVAKVMVIKMVKTGNLLYEYTSLKKLWKTLNLSE